MKKQKTPLPGLLEIIPKIFTDARGYFMETYRQNAFEEIGVPRNFVQDNQSGSFKGVLRGLHFQIKKPQAKLVRVISGKVFDVAVDLRPGSDTYGKWHGVTLCSQLKNMLYIPEGFAHGFLTLSDTAELSYKCSDFYDPGDEGGILWNDPFIGIKWPDTGIAPILSEKDLTYSPIHE